jgi:hypothetical protein
MRSFQIKGKPNSTEMCPFERKTEGELDTEAERGEDSRKIKAEIRVICLHTQEHQGLPGAMRN